MDTYRRWRNLDSVWASDAVPCEGGFRPFKPATPPAVCVGHSGEVLADWRKKQKRRK